MAFDKKGTLVLNGISYSGGSSDSDSSVDLEYYEQNGFLSRNLLKAELESTTQFGVTLTKNGNEYIVNGTASGGTAIFTIGKIHLEQGKKYKIVGSKGSSADAFAYVVANGQWKRDYSTTANPFTSEVTEDTDYIIRVVSGKTANNLTFRPMVSENVDDDYDTFMPYVPSNVELQKQIPTELEDLSNVEIDPLNSNQEKNDGDIILYNKNDDKFYITMLTTDDVNYINYGYVYSLTDVIQGIQNDIGTVNDLLEGV